MLQLFVLSIGAIYALIPLVIIIILIAAAVGLTRGSTIFELFGIEALVGMASAKNIGAGKAGTGIGGTTMTKMQARQKLAGFGATSAGKTQKVTGTLAASAAQKASTNAEAAAMINKLAKQGNPEAVAAVAAGAAAFATASQSRKGKGIVNLAVSSPPPPPPFPGAKPPSRWNRSTNVFTTRTQRGGNPLLTMQVPAPLSIMTWRTRAGSWRTTRAESRSAAAASWVASQQHAATIAAYRQHAGPVAHQMIMQAAKYKTNPSRVPKPLRRSAYLPLSKPASKMSWIYGHRASAPIPQTRRQMIWSFYKGTGGALKRKLREEKD